MTGRLMVGAVGALLLLMGPAAAAAAAGGGGGGGGGGHCDGFSEGQSLELRDSCISGTAHFAAPGDLDIRNTGETVHNLVAVDGSFRTADLGGGRSETLRLDTGIHRVYCTIHGSSTGTGMAGVIVVGDAQPIAATSPLPEADESGSSGTAWSLVLVLTAVAGVAGLVAVTVFRRRGSVAAAA